MTVDDVRAHLRPLLEKEYGVEGAAFLIDRPPGGWSDLVTNQTLERELDGLRQEIKADVAELRTDMAGLGMAFHKDLQELTWKLVKLVIAAQGVVLAAIVGVGAMIRFA